MVTVKTLPADVLIKKRRHELVLKKRISACGRF